MKKNLPSICFIGCGKIAERHAKVIKKLFPKLEISFASRDNKKSKEFSEKFNGKYFFNSYQDALSSSKFNIAFITTPHAYHAELAVSAADNKLDIIIEKPVSRDLKELSLIENAVKKNNVRCTVSENYFYKPFIKKIRNYIDNDIIGKVLFIELSKTNRDMISGWRTDPLLMGGGALLEGGVHWINVLVSLADAAPKKVIAMKPEVVYQTNVPFEDSIILNVEFENGIVGKLLHSWRIPNPLRGASISKIYGTDGVITFESNGLFFTVHGKKKRLSLTNPFDFLGFKAMFKSFIEAYINDQTWEPSLERIKTEMRVIESAYKSLKSKKIERV